MFVDSHAHLDDPRFNDDREAIIQRAWDAGIRRILTIGNGSGPDGMGCGIPIAEKYDWIFTSVGVHPHDAVKLEDGHMQLMGELADHPKVIAIGETGLDYHYDNSPRDVQRAVFRRQVELAVSLDLPVIVHTREADDDTIDILRQTAPRRGVLHCFTSGDALADFAVENGFMISFSGIVTFPNARRLADTARRMPSDKVLVETDCPYLAPIPHRGRRNEPAFVADTARFVAEARGMSVEALAAETSANFARLFSVSETA
jgi:TatD DNase family protein